jgi:hypothetical protein
MSTRKQISASRKNGAKSHGPVTPEGKQRVADNAIQHGLCSRRMLLPDESEDELHTLEIHWLRELYPQTPGERELVMDVVACAWRIKRFQRAEAQLLAVEMDKHGDDPNALGHAITALSGSQALVLLNRYATRARREFDHALATYRETAQLRLDQQRTDRLNLESEVYFAKWGTDSYQVAHSKPSYIGRAQDFLPNKPEPANIILPSPQNIPPDNF